MAKENETIADIIAAMRDEGHTGESSCLEWVGTKMRYYADRLEAAHNREAAFHAMTCEANDRLREHLQIALDANKREVGDCAKLREALVRCRNCAQMIPPFVQASKPERSSLNAAADYANLILQDVADGLAAPPRNCDVYNNESCRMAYHLHGDGLMTMQAFADWLFAPATKKEGGAK